MRVWHLLLILAVVGGAMIGVLWYRAAAREQAAEAERQALEQRLNNPEGYAADRVEADLRVKTDAKLAILLAGRVRNRGDRALEAVLVKLERLDDKGEPAGASRTVRLDPFAPGETRVVEKKLGAVEKDRLVPDPRRGGRMTFKLPPMRATVASVEFAE